MSDVSTQTSAVNRMAKHWPMIEALLEGTHAMRAAGEKFMPKWPNEEPKAYEARVKSATLFPAYSRTIEVLGAKPFSKALTISDDVPARIKEYSNDIDLQGNNLHVFAASVFTDALGFGQSGILVDYPKAEPNNKVAVSGVKTKAQEEAEGLRPYFIHVTVKQVLGWRSERRAGAEVLTQLRIMEGVCEPDGDFGEKLVEQVRVLTIGAWETWRKKEVAAATSAGGTWQQYDKGTTTLNKIPFVPVYAKRTGFMTSMPPLLDLAYMNVEHWQSKSDQQTILHVARVPILTIIGGDEKTVITIGASSAIRLPQGGDMKFVEHSGKAIEAGAKSLDDLATDMRHAGAELLVMKQGGEITATEVLSDNEQGMCALQRMAHGGEDALDQALQIMAEWIGEPSGGSVQVYKEFGMPTLAAASSDLLLKMNQAGKLSDETLFSEVKRRGEIASDVEWKAEQERIANQPPPLGGITDNTPNNPAA